MILPESFALFTNSPLRCIFSIAECSSGVNFSIRAFSCSVTVSAFTTPAATNFSRFDITSPSDGPNLAHVCYRTGMIAPDLSVSTKNSQFLWDEFYFGHHLAAQDCQA